MFAMQINLSCNALCGLDEEGYGTYTADGIKAIADSIAVTASLTQVDVRYNRLGMQDKAILRKAFHNLVRLQGSKPCTKAVEGRSGFELLQ